MIIYNNDTARDCNLKTALLLNTGDLTSFQEATWLFSLGWKNKKDVISQVNMIPRYIKVDRPQGMLKKMIDDQRFIYSELEKKADQGILKKKGIKFISK